jgi:hypothetical protein
MNILRVSVACIRLFGLILFILKFDRNFFRKKIFGNLIINAPVRGATTLSPMTPSITIQTPTVTIVTLDTEFFVY